VFEIHRAGKAISTDGLAPAISFELMAEVQELDLQDAAVNLVTLLARYFVDSGRSLSPGETIDWGSSLLVTRKVGEKLVSLDEYEYDGETIRTGVTNAVSLWAGQSEVCREVGSAFLPCRFGEKIAVSPGLLESTGVVEGVRYPAKTPMSGWWLLTEDYDGRPDHFASMKPTHVFHVLQQRPDVGRYLGLSTGYAFLTNSESSVWFEAEIASQPVP
jgi:hypothetical protein